MEEQGRVFGNNFKSSGDSVAASSTALAPVAVIAPTSSSSTAEIPSHLKKYQAMLKNGVPAPGVAHKMTLEVGLLRLLYFSGLNKKQGTNQVTPSQFIFICV